jgi:hypothetical protein
MSRRVLLVMMMSSHAGDVTVDCRKRLSLQELLIVEAIDLDITDLCASSTVGINCREL